MEIPRRTFMASLSAAATVNLFGESAGAQQSKGSPAFDPEHFRARANADGEFKATSRFWNARVRMEIGETFFDAVIKNGTIVDFTLATETHEPNVRIVGPT